ncbi:hypothetical protein [Pedobacter nutrimenti]|uniref:hypothetical protein n=1 Tax=Pedobacter nutrimenti TaxID=1241337 RepID=UPI00292E3C34|nr:hypothetical protein [Pedobacter nutrimenti]
MPFPFSIKYTTPLEGKVNPEDYPLILKQISDFIIPKPAKDIVIENNGLRFNPGSSPSRWNLMNPIDRGTFLLNGKEGQTALSYEFFMYKHFIYTSIIAAVIGLGSQRIWVGIIVFLWVCGFRWLIALAKHKDMFDELVKKINSASGQRELSEEPLQINE